MENPDMPATNGSSGPHSDEEMQKPQQPPSGGAGHSMTPNDPLNPMNWPLWKKIYASATAFLFTLALLFSATSYTTGIAMVVTEFGVSMQHAILPYSLFLFGIVFAPITSPHIAERVGRRPLYVVSVFSMAMFLIGSSQSKTFTQLAVTRFFAGFCGGPCVVNIEGTFADIWPALNTGTYYAALTMASYLGAALGAVVCGNVVPLENWRYAQYISLMFIALSLIFGALAPETYPREIIRIHARKAKQPHNLPPAASGATVLGAANLTIVQPLRMAVAEPVVMGTALVLSLNFGILFSWFVAVPVVLKMTYGFDLRTTATGFSSAIVAIVVAAITTIAIDQLARRLAQRAAMKKPNGMMALSIEYRLVPAMIGGAWILASLFWVGFTAKPAVDFKAPITGTVFYVWGSFMSLTGYVSYLFDAFTPQGILSALTLAACLRVFFAGLIPLFILVAISNLTGAWALSVFGFVSVLFLPWPFFLFFFGERLRRKSAFAPREVGAMDGAADMPEGDMSALQSQLASCRARVNQARRAGYLTGDFAVECRTVQPEPAA